VRTLIRHAQGVIHRLVPNGGNRRWLKNDHFWRAEVAQEKGATYPWDPAASTIPAEGNANQASGSLIVRIHCIDPQGNNWRWVLETIQTWDLLFIGTASARVINAPIWNGLVAQFSVENTWVPPAAGTYRIYFERDSGT
jgi:hypothetical protein